MRDVYGNKVVTIPGILEMANNFDFTLCWQRLVLRSPYQ